MPESTPHYIEFRQVSKTFDTQPVLEQVSFQVDPGETVVILGRSGVGKSVALSHIMGFLRPDAGRVFVAHQDITEATEPELLDIHKRVTLVFQSGALFDSLSVAENVAFPLRERAELTEQDTETIVEGMLELVNISELRERMPAELSTGMKRAVAIARALAAKPEAILYDEPTTMGGSADVHPHRRPPPAPERSAPADLGGGDPRYPAGPQAGRPGGVPARRPSGFFRSDGADAS